MARRPLTVVVCCACVAQSMVGPIVMSVAAQGYQIWRNQVLVEGQQDWEAWQGVAVGHEVADDGTLRPRFVRRGINASLNATDFEVLAGRDRHVRKAGIWAVGSGSPAPARVIIDGDDATYWEPPIRTFPDGPQWVEINLGRGVIAQRIRIRFADDGDPFLKFRVMASDGEESFGSLRERRFFRVGQEAVENKSRREYVFDVPQQRPRPDGVMGEAIQAVFVEMLATDGPRGAEVTEAEYQALAPEDRGAIDYYLRTVSGREIRVVPSTYDELPADERGPTRFYRWERPRLAEVEVLAMGDNVIGLTQKPEFAVGDFFDDIAKRFVTDGLISTSFFLRAYDPLRDRNQVFIDLGARFWLDQLRLVSTRNPPMGYQFRISDGSLDATGQHVWTSLPERVNGEQFLQVEETFTAQPVRLIELRRLNLIPDRDQGEVAEIQGFGEGYVSDVTLTSPFINTGERTMFSQLHWQGESPPGTEVVVRTRTGDEIIEVRHYYNRGDVEITGPSWEQLRPFDRGRVEIEELAGADWSPWSDPYTQSDGQFRSPMPRAKTQIQVRLRSFEPLRAASLRRLTLSLASPLVSRAVGEVWPVRGVEAGAWTRFRLYVNLRAQPGDAGVDRLRVRTSSSTPMRLQAVQAGSDEGLRFAQGVQLFPGPATAQSLADGSVELELTDVRLDEETTVELQLDAKLFLPGTIFTVELRNDDRPGMVQVVDAGPASALAPSNALVVTADLERTTLLDRLQIEPAVATPNGDGINDEINIQVTIYQLAGARRIRAVIVDLTGRVRRDLSVRPELVSGEHTLGWDGRDDGGQLLPPGNYVVLVEVDTDHQGVVRRTGTVALAY